MSSKGIAGGEHTLYVSSEGSLHSTGACGLGWCRLQPLNDSLFQFKSLKIPEPVSLVYASYYHNLAVGKVSGSLYTWGCGTFVEGGMDGVIPALGQGNDAQDTGAMPTVVKLPFLLNNNGSNNKESIRAVTGGAYHSAVLSSTGRIFTFGAGQLGQLGRSVKNKGDASGLPVDPEPISASIPKINGKESIITNIGSGFYNTFAICAKGKLFCTGENQNKQCGIGDKNLNAFTQVKEVDNEVVDQVEGGYCHTLIKTIGGKVFSLGCGEDGQRGDNRRDDDDDDANRPVMTEVNIPVKAKQVAAGANHSVILGSDGNAYTFGANDVGQCGVDSDDQPSMPSEDDNNQEDIGQPILAPKKVQLPENTGNVIHVSAGYAHTILTTDSGSMYVFGQNDNGQLGLGSDDKHKSDCMRSPSKINPPI